MIKVILLLCAVLLLSAPQAFLAPSAEPIQGVVIWSKRGWGGPEDSAIAQFVSVQQFPAITRFEDLNGKTRELKGTPLVLYSINSPKGSAETQIPAFKAAIRDFPQYSAMLKTMLGEWEEHRSRFESMSKQVYNDEEPATRDLELANGELIRNVVVSSVDPDGIKIITLTGIDKILFKDLSDAVKAEFNYKEPPKEAPLTLEVAAAKESTLLDTGPAPESDHSRDEKDKELTALKESDRIQSSSISGSGESNPSEPPMTGTYKGIQDAFVNLQTALASEDIVKSEEIFDGLKELVSQIFRSEAKKVGLNLDSEWALRDFFKEYESISSDFLQGIVQEISTATVQYESVSSGSNPGLSAWKKQALDDVKKKASKACERLKPRIQSLERTYLAAQTEFKTQLQKESARLDAERQQEEARLAEKKKQEDNRIKEQRDQQDLAEKEREAFAEGATRVAGTLPTHFEPGKEYVLEGLLLIRSTSDGMIADLLPSMMADTFESIIPRQTALDQNNATTGVVFQTMLDDFVQNGLYRPMRQVIYLVPVDMQAYGRINLQDRGTVLTAYGTFETFRSFESPLGAEVRVPAFRVTKLSVVGGQEIKLE